MIKLIPEDFHQYLGSPPMIVLMQMIITNHIQTLDEMPLEGATLVVDRNFGQRWLPKHSLAGDSESGISLFASTGTA